MNNSIFLNVFGDVNVLRNFSLEQLQIIYKAILSGVNPNKIAKYVDPSMSEFQIAEIINMIGKIPDTRIDLYLEWELSPSQLAMIEKYSRNFKLRKYVKLLEFRNLTSWDLSLLSYALDNYETQYLDYLLTLTTKDEVMDNCRREKYQTWFNNKTEYNLDIILRQWKNQNQIHDKVLYDFDHNNLILYLSLPHECLFLDLVKIKKDFYKNCKQLQINLRNIVIDIRTWKTNKNMDKDDANYHNQTPIRNIKTKSIIESFCDSFAKDYNYDIQYAESGYEYEDQDYINSILRSFGY